MSHYRTSDYELIEAKHLPTLNREGQLDVMETWFREHFEDPAQHTPYESSEGGYIWIWGGPYDAEEELTAKFGDIVSQDLIDSVVEKLQLECFEWAGTLGDYDDEFIADIATISDYHDNFLKGLQDTRNLAETTVSDETTPLLFRLLYVNVITLLETFLSDAFTNTVLNDPSLLRKFVETTPDFQKQKLSRSEVFKAVEDADGWVKKHLSRVIWHNLDRVKSLYRNVLDVEITDSTPISNAVKMRHDLVHRNGNTRDGKVITIDKEKVLSLSNQVEEFVALIDQQLHFIAAV